MISKSGLDLQRIKLGKAGIMDSLENLEGIEKINAIMFAFQDVFQELSKKDRKAGVQMFCVAVDDVLGWINKKEGKP